MGGLVSSQCPKVVLRKHIENRLQKTKSESVAITRLEKFIYLVYSKCQQEEVMKAIVRSEAALNAFSLFIILSDKKKCENMLTTAGRTVDFTHHAETILSEELGNFFSNTFVNSEKSEFVDYVFENLTSFLRSDGYKNWRKSEESDILFADYQSILLQTTLPELCSQNSYKVLAEASILPDKKSDLPQCMPIEVLSVSNANNAVRSSISSVIHSSRSVSRRTQFAQLIEPEFCDISPPPSAVQNALKVCDPMEVSTLLKSDYWLTMLITAAETLPIGVTLSTANYRRPGFPFIYVNEVFAKMAGKKREELIGAPCTYLTESTDHFDQQRETLATVAAAVQSADPVVAALISAGNNGDLFSNVVGVKSVLDESNRYRYLITLQMDATSYSSIGSCCLLVKEFIDTIPSTISAEFSLFSPKDGLLL